MNGNKDIVTLRLISNMIIDWCNDKAKNKIFIFDNSFVSSYQKFRFATPVINQILPSVKGKKSVWDNEYYCLYEIKNDNGNLSVSLLVSSKGLSNNERLSLFLKSNRVEYGSDIIVIKTWNILNSNARLEDLTIALDHFLFIELKAYEKEIGKWLNDSNYAIYDIDYELVEGAIKNISTNKYERNKEARKKCIEFHGTKCKICGFDFGKVYGEEFEGKIEVHHKKPLNEIKEEYVVDPINDLIPVCPNCHMIIHSKEEGVYTPEEVASMLNISKSSI